MTGYTPVTNHHESPTEPATANEPSTPPGGGDNSHDIGDDIAADIAPDIATDIPTDIGDDIAADIATDIPTDIATARQPDMRELVDIPAVEVISRAVVMLMSAAAEQLGLASDDPDAPAHRDLDQARTLITALAGLVNAAAPELGPHAGAFRDGLGALQAAFREYSVHPDEPGHGPGERARR